MKVYGETSLGKDKGLDETSMLEPTNPYSAAKAGAEMMARAYLTSYKMPVIVTRGNNVYGPRQFPEKLIPKFTLLAKRGEQLPVHGDGEAVRSYLHVSDVATAFDTILHKGQVRNWRWMSCRWLSRSSAWCTWCYLTNKPPKNAACR
jgi:dTDP-D-glucose 4,6-dehydratase